MNCGSGTKNTHNRDPWNTGWEGYNPSPSPGTTPNKIFDIERKIILKA